jgi:oxaloacetate decarboxylase alpha subunit
LHVLSAQRWRIVVDELRDLVDGRYGSPPGDVDPLVRRAVDLIGDGRPRADEGLQGIEEIRSAAEGLATSEEDLLLIALFGDQAEPLLQAIRARGRSDESLSGTGLERSETERIRELIRVVQESGIGEVTIEEGETRVTIRRTEEEAPQAAGIDAAAAEAPPGETAEPSTDSVIRIEAPMVGTFYRAPQPGAAPFVQEGDAIELGQTLCILEAMKLMNEVKAETEGIVRRICVENAQPVEYGQVLFELDPLNGRPLDAL